MKPKQILKAFAGLGLGLFIGAFPFFNYMFAVHNPKCPCHSPINMIKQQWHKWTPDN